MAQATGTTIPKYSIPRGEVLDKYQLRSLQQVVYFHIAKRDPGQKVRGSFSRSVPTGMARRS